MSFNVVMTGSNVRVVDNTKYVYGCTIDGNETLQRSVGYLWKTVTPTVGEDVKLTFRVTEAEAQAGTPQYLVWNLSNIGDNSTFRLHLKNIEIEKSADATNPYIDFPNTKILYLDEVANTTVFETRAMESYITTASYDELKLKVESLSGCEHFYVPIKGLTSGKTYTIYFDELTTNMTLGNGSAYDYGAWVDISYAYTGKNKLWVNKVHVSQSSVPHYCVQTIGSWNSNNTFTFTASATTMYWVWEYAAFSDNVWGNIHLRNVSIKEGTATALMSLKSEVNKQEENIVENEINDLNMVSNTTMNLTQNNIQNQINENILENKITNTTTNTNSNTNTNTNTENNIVENKVDNTLTNTESTKNTSVNEINNSTINTNNSNIVNEIADSNTITNSSEEEDENEEREVSSENNILNETTM